MQRTSHGRLLTPDELQALLEGGQDALFVADPAGEMLYLNLAARTLYGVYEQTEHVGGRANLHGTSPEALDVRTLDGVPVAAEDRPVARLLRGETNEDVELLVRLADDDDPRVYVYSHTVLKGEPALSVLTVRDETDRWRSERRYRVVFEADPAPSVIARLADMCIVEANQGMAELTGVAVGDLESRSLTDLEPLHPYNDVLEIVTKRLLSGRLIHKVKTTLRSAHGAEITVVLSARAIEVDDQPCGIYTFIDLSELEAAQREHQATQEQLSRAAREHADEKDVLAYLAIFDPLTGIPNRRGLDVRLAEEFERAERYGGALSILLIDVDHFKVVNDERGHDAGDAALRQIAHLLRESGRGPDFAGRWGGEEFLMILPETGTEAASDVAGRVRARIANAAFAGIGHLTVSIGVASHERGGTVETLFKKADRAMYAAKAGGRNRVEVAGAGEGGA